MQKHAKNATNKAKAISAKLLELNLKNKLEVTGGQWNKKKGEEREKLEELDHETWLCRIKEDKSQSKLW